jgi:hypothetical protein
MALDSLEYKQRLVDFGGDMNTLCGHLYAAVTDGVDPDRKAELMASARRKSQQYDDLLPQLGENQRAEIESLYADDVNTLREFLSQLEASA